VYVCPEISGAVAVGYSLSSVIQLRSPGELRTDVHGIPEAEAGAGSTLVYIGADDRISA